MYDLTIVKATTDLKMGQNAVICLNARDRQLVAVHCKCDEWCEGPSLQKEWRDG